MNIYVQAMFVNDKTKEELHFIDYDGMHGNGGIFIYQTLRKYLKNDSLDITLENGLCKVSVENNEENIAIIKNIYEDNGSLSVHPGYFQTPSHLKFYVIQLPDAGLVETSINRNLYVCECGCKLEFIAYQNGLDIYIGEKWLITQNALSDYVWNDYVPSDKHKTWQELKDHLIAKYNERVLNNMAHSGPYRHLYNNYVNVEYDPIPLDGKLYYQYAF